MLNKKQLRTRKECFCSEI